MILISSQRQTQPSAVRFVRSLRFPLVGFAAVLVWLAAGSVATADVAAGAQKYTWHDAPINLTLGTGIAVPSGFKRVAVEPGSFAAWLRGLPLKPVGSDVHLYTGAPKWRQDVHVAVVDIDVGKRDLQQCADAIMRLRAEWLYGSGRASQIAFNYTGGGRVGFGKWAKGYRPSQSGKSWRKRAKANGGYGSFRRYMTQVFAYAGTYSLSKELRRVAPSNMQIGDVFIKGGFPGHAVLVVDMIENEASGEKRFLLLQSFMPAQEMHILKNPDSVWGSPWYESDVSWPLVTPEWQFDKGSLKRWP